MYFAHQPRANIRILHSVDDAVVVLHPIERNMYIAHRPRTYIFAPYTALTTLSSSSYRAKYVDCTSATAHEPIFAHYTALTTISSSSYRANYVYCTSATSLYSHITQR